VQTEGFAAAGRCIVDAPDMTVKIAITVVVAERFEDKLSVERVVVVV
jgi:hypothetical protein